MCGGIAFFLAGCILFCVLQTVQCVGGVGSNGDDNLQLVFSNGKVYQGIDMRAGLPPIHEQMGWLGGDADVSVRLNTTHSIWIFADTLVGFWYPKTLQREQAGMALPENTVAIVNNQNVDVNGTIRPQYYYRFNREAGYPDGIWHPENRTEKYWPTGAFYDAEHTGALIIEFQHIRHIDDPAKLYIETLGTVFVTVKNPLDAPWDWQHGPYSTLPFPGIMITGMLPVPSTTTTNQQQQQQQHNNKKEKNLVYMTFVYLDAEFSGTYVLRARVQDVYDGDMAAMKKHTEFWKEGEGEANAKWVAWSKEGKYQVLLGTDVMRPPELQMSFDSHFNCYWFPYLGFADSRIRVFYTQGSSITDRFVESTQDVYVIPPPLSDAAKYFCYAVKPHQELPSLSSHQEENEEGKNVQTWKMSYACNVWQEETLYEAGGIVAYFPTVFQVDVSRRTAV